MPRKRKHQRATTQYWIGYCRKSTDTEDKQIYTLQDQALLIEEYYAKLPPQDRSSHPLRLFQEAQSAYHPGRPVFQSILGMADRGEVLGLIVVHPNRISRNHADSGSFVQRLVEGRIRYLDTTGGKRYTGGDSNDIFMLTLEGAMSWKDSRDKGDRILQAMRLRAAEGKHMGPVRIGYHSVYRPDGTTVLETVPEIAAQIRRVFELAATGSYSIQDLVHKAEEMGLRSRGGKKLNKPAIHALLRDPLYKGYIRFAGNLAKGRHEPLVEELVWSKVQAVLRSRRTSIPKPKDLALRELFVFGNLLKCPQCGRTLCPYRVKQKYIYYECKNPERACGVLVSQKDLVAQLPPLLASISPGPEDLERMRKLLLRQHEERSGDELKQRKSLNAAYEQVTKEIGEVFAQRKEAEAMGVLDAVDRKLGELRGQRDELQGQMNTWHEKGSAWIDTVIRTFELMGLLQEAILFGSMHARELALRGIASNYRVERGKLVPELRSPFRQKAKSDGVLEWWSGLYDVRTETAETYERLKTAASLLPVESLYRKE